MQCKIKSSHDFAQVQFFRQAFTQFTNLSIYPKINKILKIGFTTQLSAKAL
jgi:hypothetical protein